MQAARFEVFLPLPVDGPGRAGQPDYSISSFEDREAALPLEAFIQSLVSRLDGTCDTGILHTIF